MFSILDKVYYEILALRVQKLMTTKKVMITREFGAVKMVSGIRADKMKSSSFYQNNKIYLQGLLGTGCTTSTTD